jgi:hypothetical protein
MRRDPRAAVTAALTLALGLTLGGMPAHAQDGTLCVLLTPEEVAAALGGGIVSTGDGNSLEQCLYLSDAAGGYSNLSVSHILLSPNEQSSIAEMAEIWQSGGVETVVGGLPARQEEGSVYVFPDLRSAIWLKASAGDDIDVATAVKSLAELAVSRLGSVALPTAMPVPSFVGDPELTALYPAQIAGEPVKLRTIAGPELASESADMSAKIEALLAGHGKTLGDFSLGTADSYEPTYTLIAIRVKGADISTMTSELLTLLGLTPEQVASLEPTQMAGKDVLKAPSGVFYPKNDVLWSISAQEPTFTEIMQHLP